MVAPILKALDIAGPYIHTGYEKSMELWEQAQAYHIKELFPAFLGLFMCFFGGKFMVTLVYDAHIYGVVTVSLPLGNHRYCGSIPCNWLRNNPEVCYDPLERYGGALRVTAVLSYLK